VTHSTAADPTKGAVSEWLLGVLKKPPPNTRTSRGVYVAVAMGESCCGAAEDTPEAALPRNVARREASENVGVDEKKGRKEKKGGNGRGNSTVVSQTLLRVYASFIPSGIWEKTFT